MKKVLLIIGAAAFAATMPALAEGPKGNSGKGNHSMSAKGHAIGGKHSAKQAGKSWKGSSTADPRKKRTAGLTDTNGDGRVDRRDVLDRNRDGIDDRTGNRYGGAACPPGLAKKSPACVPPGLAKRQFAEGQRIPNGYNAFTDYSAIPEAYRSQVPYSAANQYIYRDNQVYIVDPATRAVTSIINLIR